MNSLLKYHPPSPHAISSPNCKCISSQLHLDVHPSRQVELHERVNGLGRGVLQVNEALVGLDLEVLAGVLVHVGGTEHAVDAALSREGHGARHIGTSGRSGIKDLCGSCLYEASAVGLELDADLLLGGGGNGHDGRVGGGTGSDAGGGGEGAGGTGVALAARPELGETLKHGGASARDGLGGGGAGGAPDGNPPGGNGERGSASGHCVPARALRAVCEAGNLLVGAGAGLQPGGVEGRVLP
mmetsp:Transcript_32619/g.103953  ORF Transcript_32619/g.103953 Transcript_32619/m.103953 type:complete len:241 (-) Transcript_32619:19-741(-)